MSDKKRSILTGTFSGAFIALLVTNRCFEDSCWFYSDAKGEYSFSEMLTNALYLVASLLLLRLAWLQKGLLLLGAAALCFLLLLEESNYGQVFWGESDTNFHDNEGQAALHTQLLRPIFVVGSFDAAELMSIAMLGFFTVVVPVILKYWLKIRLAVYHLWVPLALACVCYVGKWVGFLIPWNCGYDSAEEVVETFMAASAVYWALLYQFSTGAEEPESEPEISSMA